MKFKEIYIYIYIYILKVLRRNGNVVEFVSGKPVICKVLTKKNIKALKS